MSIILVLLYNKSFDIDVQYYDVYIIDFKLKI